MRDIVGAFLVFIVVPLLIGMFISSCMELIDGERKTVRTKQPSGIHEIDYVSGGGSSLNQTCVDGVSYLTFGSHGIIVQVDKHGHPVTCMEVK